jgi:hypothetical protein
MGSGPTLGDFFYEITYGKNDERFTDGEIERYYSPFVITKMLATDPDFVVVADLLNNMNLDNKSHFLFLMHVFPKRKLRMPAFPAKVKNEDMELIMEFYNISDTKAVEYLSILSKEQIQIIYDCLNNGGREK